MASLRIERVRELLKREIGEAIRREFHVNEVGLITVNDVDVAGDLKSAIVFISILGNAEQQKRGFQLLDRAPHPHPGPGRPRGRSEIHADAEICSRRFHRARQPRPANHRGTGKDHARGCGQRKRRGRTALKNYPKIIDRISKSSANTRHFALSAMSGRMAIASARNSAWRWRCGTRAKK